MIAPNRQHEVDPRLDGNLDRLLTGLGSATPSLGFEQRILARTAEARTAEAHANQHVLQTRQPVSFRFWPLGFVGALACLLLAVVSLRHHLRENASPQLLSPQVLFAGRPAVQAGVTPPKSRAVDALERLPAAPGAHRPVRSSQPSHSSAQLPVRDAAAPALASFPAPPLPLTEQERLMLRIIHKGDPEEIAMLNPDFRESLFSHDQAEFKDFFKPPPPVPDPDPIPPAAAPAKGVSK